MKLREKIEGWLAPVNAQEAQLRSERDSNSELIHREYGRILAEHLAVILSSDDQPQMPRQHVEIQE